MYSAKVFLILPKQWKNVAYSKWHANGGVGEGQVEEDYLEWWNRKIRSCRWCGECASSHSVITITYSGQRDAKNKNKKTKKINSRT